MSTIEFCSRSKLQRGVEPMTRPLNMDGTGMAALLNSRAHAHLRERLHAAKSSDFVVYVVAQELGEGDALLRRCSGSELRTKLRSVVLPIAGERHGVMQPQMMLDGMTYAPMLDNDNDIVVPYLVSFFLTPLENDALPKTLTMKSAELLMIDCKKNQKGQQIVCTLQPNVLERSGPFAADAIMCLLSQQFPVRHTCGGCGMVVDGRLKCALCKQTVYCGKACQRAHWSNGGHKHLCDGKDKSAVV